ncbi:hypothetical protein TSUD_183080 [Trifolium subterraneum]|uniref:Retrotransposon gag domain-containing protein n=1 Tax=Trifolium subterraneum TaxID=3900 RepID=A0A2Z6NM83_TRISU|nr:hypothetical protein TSUD_183080 [Trifolium subterraneum]
MPLPRGLEKPPSLDKYDGTTDPDEHIQTIETALGYRNLRGSIKCKLFPLSLVRGASTWWRSLPQGSIDSWDELCRLFKAHFTTSKRHPKMVANLKAIVQEPEEPLRSYIERFNKVSVEVVDATNKMKLYLLEDGLREGTKLQEAIGIMEMETLDEFFELAQRFNKVSVEVVDATNKMKLYLLEDGLREGTKLQEAIGIMEMETLDEFFELAQRYIKWEEKQKGLRGYSLRYQTLNSKARAYDSRSNCPQNQMWTRKNYVDSTRVTGTSLKTACISKMPLKSLFKARHYVKGEQRENTPRQNQLTIEAPSPDQNTQEDANKVPGGVAFAISRPEDFFPLPDNNEREALDYLTAHLDGS